MHFVKLRSPLRCENSVLGTRDSVAQELSDKDHCARSAEVRTERRGADEAAVRRDEARLLAVPVAERRAVLDSLLREKAAQLARRLERRLERSGRLVRVMWKGSGERHKTPWRA